MTYSSPAPRLPSSAWAHAAIAKMERDLDRALTVTSRTLDVKARKVERGDKVQLTVTAYVQAVNADGTVSLASTREPFDDPIVLDRCHRTRLTRIESAPAEPKIGDTITGKTVRETPWQRGTILVDRTPGLDSEGARFVLLGSGDWISLTRDDREPFEFDAFGDDERFEVESAPGKAKRYSAEVCNVINVSARRPGPRIAPGGIVGTPLGGPFPSWVF